MGVIVLEHHAPLRGVALCTVEFSFDAGEKIIVMVDAARCCEFDTWSVGGWVTDSAALSPLFVPLDAGQGTGSR